MLFNKSNTGQDELKALLGFLYASNEFDNIKTDITLAEEDAKKIIGKEIFALAQSHYDSANYEAPDDDSASGSASGVIRSNTLLTELVHKIQLPVAYLAVYNYSPNSDVTHSEKGRMILKTENEIPAYSGLIDADNEALNKKYNKTLDRLIAFLDEYIADFPEWSDSTAYSTSKSLFINSAIEFNNIYPIEESRAFYIRILPFIKEIERKHIIPTLTKELADEIKQQIKDNDLTAENAAILEYIRVPLALLSMAIAVKRLSVAVLPDGIFQFNQDSNQAFKGKTPAPMDVRNALLASLNSDGDEELKNLQEYLIKVEQGDDYDASADDLTARHLSTNKYFRT